MEQQRQQKHERNWEQMGAASALFATLLFVVAFIIFLSTDPSGGNHAALPNVVNAEAAPGFFGYYLSAVSAGALRPPAEAQVVGPTDTLGLMNSSPWIQTGRRDIS